MSANREFLINIDFNGDTPINLQLERQICEAVLAGTLQPGDRVPGLIEVQVQLNKHGYRMSPPEINILKLTNMALEGLGVLELRSNGVYFITEQAFMVARDYRQRGWKP